MNLNCSKNCFFLNFLILILIYFGIFYFFENASNISIFPSKEMKINEKFLFCMILTHPGGFRNKKPQIVYNVWGSRCDHFKFITIRPNISLNVNSLFFNLTGIKKETYNRLSRKVFSAFKETYQEYPDFDWYLKADDDTFIEMDNLREFLKNKNQKEPVTFGHDLSYRKQVFHSGGAGYLLSNEAFTRLGEAMHKNDNYCKIDYSEDVDVARCLRSLGVNMKKSIDSLGRERFNLISIQAAFTGNFSKWFLRHKINKYQKVFFLIFY